MSYPFRVTSELIIQQNSECVAEAIVDKIQREVEADFDIYEYLHELNYHFDPAQRDILINAEMAELLRELYAPPTRSELRNMKYDDIVQHRMNVVRDSLIERVVELRTGEFQ